MEYRKKIKRNTWLFVGYALIGVVLIILNCAKIVESDYFMSFGTVTLAVSVIRIIRYMRIMNNDEKMRKLEIAYKDERNIMINDKAKNLAFAVYIYAAAAAMIVFAMLHMDEIMQCIAYSICALVFIYWVCYHIIKRKY